MVVKPELYQCAVKAFEGTNVRITTEGKPHLGAPLRSVQYRKDFVQAKVEEWKNAITAMAKIATSHPQAVYAALTHGFSSKWVFLSRVVPDIATDLQALEDSIRSTLLPAVTGRLPFNDIERQLVALPARLGGFGIGNPAEQSSTEFTASQKITNPLTSAILSGFKNYSYDICSNQITAKSLL